MTVSPVTVEINIFSLRIKLIKINDKKGDKKMRLLIFATEEDSFNANIHIKKVTPISNNPA